MATPRRSLLPVFASRMCSWPSQPATKDAIFHNGRRTANLIVDRMFPDQFPGIRHEAVQSRVLGTKQNLVTEEIGPRIDSAPAS
jgi:hypothetical protein